MLDEFVFFKQVEASLAVDLDEIIFEFVATFEDVVKLIVAEADFAIVGDGTAIIHFPDIRPKASSEAHVARLARGVKLASCEVESVEVIACIAYGRYLAMAGRVVVAHHSVVAMTHNLAILHDDRTERSAMTRMYAFPCLFDGHLHIIVCRFFHSFRFCAKVNE